MAEIDGYKEPLTELAKELKPQTVLEIGVGYEGYSTNAWLESGAKVVAIDRQDWNHAAKYAKERYGKQFTFLQGDSKELLPQAQLQYDLIYIDGDHSYEGCKADIINSIPLVKPGGYLVADDYGVTFGAVDIDTSGRILDGNYGVKQAVDELISWPEYLPKRRLANGGKVFRKPWSV